MAARRFPAETFPLGEVSAKHMAEALPAAQAELLLASTEDGISSSVQPYTFDGTTVTPTDRRLRTVVSLTAQVRNALR